MPKTTRDRCRSSHGSGRWPAVLLFALAALHCAPEDPSSPERAATTIQPILSPSNPQIAQGTAAQFTMRSLHSDGHMKEVTAQVTWSLVREGGGRLPAPTAGLVELELPGRYQVTADYAGRRLQTTIVVTDATLKSLALAPTAPQVAVGLTQQFQATATFSDGTTQDVSAMSAWSAKDTVGTGVATVTSRGLAAGKKVGKARISARYRTLTASATLTVTAATLQSLAIGPLDSTIAKGTAQSYVAQGTFSDGTIQDLSATVDWAVADLMGSGVASIDSLGTAVGVAEGKVTVSAAYLDQLAETTLTVSPAVVTGLLISPSAAAINKGTSRQFAATAVFSDASRQDVTRMAAWTAADVAGSGVASVDSGGLAKGNAVGSAGISCQFRGLVASAPLTVTPAALTAVALTPASATIAKGLSQPYVLVGTYSDGSTQSQTTAALWAATDLMGSDVTSVSASGVALAKNEGKATVTATYLGKSATATLTVTSATLVRISISPPNATIAVAATQQFAAQGNYTDGSAQDLTTRVTWSATDIAPGSGVATITTGGLATGKTKGQATISASYLGLHTDVLLVVGGIKVASLYCSTDIAGQNDVKLKLDNLHLFARVDNVDMSAAAPTLMTLQQYDAVLIWADLSRGGCSDPIAVGNVLSQYVDAGGGVTLINPYYLGNSYNNVYSPSWDKYVLIEPGSMTYVSSSSLGTADLTHPIMRGVAKIETNGSRCYQRAGASGATIRSGATVIATWAGGNALVVAGKPGGKPRVDINLYVFSSDVGSNGCYDSTSDAAKLFGNALLWVAGR